MRLFGLCALACALFVSFTSVSARAETIAGLGGKLKLEAPADWKAVPPKSRIVEYEFQAPGPAGAEPARVTTMSAGGSIDDNITRWINQFKVAEGTKPKQEKVDVGTCTVHLVEVAGTYKESMGGGPFAPGPTVEKADYALLGAIIAKGDAKYFVKMVGAKPVIEQNREAFKKMVNELKTE